MQLFHWRNIVPVSTMKVTSRKKLHNGHGHSLISAKSAFIGVCELLEFVRLHPFDRLRRHLAFALVAEFLGSILERQPKGMGDFVLHLFFDVADLSAPVTEQKKTD